MNRISQCLGALKEQGRKALVTYIVNGDPHKDVGLDAMNALVEGGADIIELGVPFSDPMAEGPVIQRGHERALEHHTSLIDTFALVKQFRKTNDKTPVVIMGYANPIERMGYELCADRALEAGVDGILTVDLPVEEAHEHNAILKLRGVENIFLIAPTTTEERVANIAGLAGGFIYYVSLKGVTGAGNLDVAAVEKRVNLIRQHSNLPVLVGFGIKDDQSASAIGRVSDGVVVGSVLVDAMGALHDADNAVICQRLRDIITPMRSALDDLV